MAQDIIDKELKPILKYLNESDYPDLFARVMGLSADIKEYMGTQEEELLKSILAELEEMNSSISSDSSS